VPILVSACFSFSAFFGPLFHSFSSPCCSDRTRSSENH
jgi:hypothetical protein